MIKNTIKTKLKNSKGITLVSLSVTVIIILMISGVLLYNLKGNLDIKQLSNMQADVNNLSDKIATYYAENDDIPIMEEYTNEQKLANLSNIKGVFDTGKFYIIDLSKLDNLTLNYGKDYEKAKSGVDVNTLADLYIINETSHNIFYVDGVEVDGEIFYTNYSEENKDKVGIDF